MRRPSRALFLGTAAIAVSSSATRAAEPPRGPSNSPRPVAAEVVLEPVRTPGAACPPGPTCCLPPARLVACGHLTQAVTGASGACRDEADVPVEEALANWERASMGFEPAGLFDRMRIAHAAGKGHSQHELQLVCDLHGPVRAAELQRRYRWTEIEAAGGAVRVAAEPRDGVERMFVPRFEVSLDLATWRPREVRFGADGADSGRIAIAVRPNVDVLVAGFDAEKYDPAIPTEYCGIPSLHALVQTSQLAPGVEESQRQHRPVTPQIARVLEQWEGATTDSALEAEVCRFTYDLVFHAEKRAAGWFRYDGGSGNGSLEFAPAQIAAGESSSRRAPDGRKYRLLADRPQAWTDDGGKVQHVVFAEDGGRVENPDTVIPADGGVRPAGFETSALDSEEFPHQVLPLVVPSSSQTLKRDFDIRQTRETEEQVWLEFEPRADARGYRFRRLELVLDKTTWLPLATRMIDASGSTETVHTFEAWKSSPSPSSEDVPLLPPAPAPLRDIAE